MADNISTGDLKINQGSDYRGTVQVYSEDGSDADLTGYTAQAQIRRDVADKCPEVAAEIEITIDPLPGLVHLFVPSSVTVTLCGRYVWDLDLTDPGGVTSTVMDGQAIVRQEVTRKVVMTAGAP